MATNLGQRSRLSLLAGLFTLLVLALTWATVAAVLQAKLTDTVNAEYRQNANLAAALQEQTARVLASADQAAQRLSDVVQAGENRPDLIRLASETGLAPRILVQLSWVGPDGRFIGSNIDPDGSLTGAIDLSEREHVRVHLNPAAGAAGDAGLFIGKPVLGKVSKRWTIQLSRRIPGPEGSTLGVVVASLDPAYFEDVYRGVSLGEQGSVTLVGRDGQVRARVLGGHSAGMGAQMGPHSPLTRGELQGTVGVFRDTSSIDAVDRFFAWQQVGQTPLLVFVATAAHEALQDWRDTRNLALGLAGLLSVVALACAGLFMVGLRRLERSHDALHQREAQAQAANRAKSEFLAAISHELRTPLASIQGFAELLERKLEPPKLREQASLIRKAALHLNDLLSEILDLAKVEAGAMQVLAGPEAIMPMTLSVADFFAPAAAAKQLDIKVRIGPVVPAQMSCDGLRVRQILNNLLSNAIKFTPAGGSIRIEVDTAPGHVRFHVVDSGPGVPPALQDQIFEKFRQGDAHDMDAAGTGLGLALSRGLAELMGGTLTLASTPGQGARFTLSLPVAGVA